MHMVYAGLISRLPARLLPVIAACLAAMSVGYCLRYFYWPVFDALGTYPGDIWYMHSNYGDFLQSQPFFRMEYPIGIFTIVKFATIVTSHISDSFKYEVFLSVNAVILGLFGLGSTIVIYKIGNLVSEAHYIPRWRVWVFWVLAPSFIYYSLLNYDLPAVFFCLLAILFHMQRNDDLSALSLGLGTVVKFFPILLLPLFVLSKSPKDAIRYCMVFGVSWLLLNLPYMLFDFNAWAFFYVWQGTREPTVDGLCYLVYRYLGSGAATAFFPLLYFGTLLYLLFGRATRGIKQLQSRSVTALKLFTPLLLTFLLANRIFSPQYILWILPFLALVSPVSLISFYVFEIANVLLTLLLFKYVTDYPELAIALRSVRYIALIAFYIQMLISSRLRPDQGIRTG